MSIGRLKNFTPHADTREGSGDWPAEVSIPVRLSGPESPLISEGESRLSQRESVQWVQRKGRYD